MDSTAHYQQPVRQRIDAQSSPLRRAYWRFLIFTFIATAGCSGTAARSPQTSDLPAQSRELENSVVNQPGDNFVSIEARNSQTRMAMLLETRKQDQSGADYPIGPGDVLVINVAALDEFSNRTVRVTGDGLILLPLVGAMRAAGATEEELREQLRKKLAAYVKEPEISIFVQEYRSRQVGVFGAVAKPGVYSLASDTDTLADMISLAGGMTTDAARRIEFLPVKVGNKNPPTASDNTQSAITPVSVNVDPSESMAHAIMIDLNDPANQADLALPARPGDVLIVPANGQVLVEGWVTTPGSYKITPGLRVLGAIAAAGGLLFPADSSGITIIRTSREGSPIRIPLDLASIKRGEHEDIPVQEADVVEVSSSTVKLVPYSAYQAVVQLFRVGVYGSAL